MAALELSLVLWSGGYSLVAVQGLLTEAASLVAERRFYGAQASLVVGTGL